MTKGQRLRYKMGNAIRRERILEKSYKRPLGQNLCIYLGGVGQRGKYGKL